jgi:NADH:ubiquinone oxidoreductase subunit 6 (subunit J)
MLPKLLGDIFAMEDARLWRGLIRLVLIISLLGLAVMAVVVGIIFMLFGLYVSLAETMKPWEAGIIVGGGVVFFATILIIIVTRQGHVVSPKGNPISEQFTGNPISEQFSNHSIAQLRPIIDNIIAQFNVKGSDIVLIALIGGIVLGASPHLRQEILTNLSDLIKSSVKKLWS